MAVSGNHVESVASVFEGNKKGTYKSAFFTEVKAYAKLAFTKSQFTNAQKPFR